MIVGEEVVVVEKVAEENCSTSQMMELLLKRMPLNLSAEGVE